jgi:poly [ADP-ribose] polymerase 2/3/4
MSIIKESMLILVSAAANSNKFYHVTLSEDGTVTKRYGRVGVAGVTNTERTGLKGYQTIINQKIRKGYTETAVVSDYAPKRNIDDISSIAKVALLGTEKMNSVLENLVDTLVRLNNHDIFEASGGLIKVNNDGIITTPLGLIDKTSIANAQRILEKLELISSGQPQFITLLEEYLRLIPQKVGSKRGWHENFFDKGNTFLKQRELLKQLGESLALRESRIKASKNDENKSSVDATAEYEKLFQLKINVLEDKAEFERINRLYESQKSHYHASSKLRLKRVFVLEDSQGKDSYEIARAKLGNERNLWHGTRAGNVLSILRKKLICPPISGTTIKIQGRLFGSGVYLGPASKSLNYSYGGVWDNGPRDNTCFMFLTNTVLGNEYHPQGRGGHSDDRIQRSGKYDSIHARAKDTGLMNDEYIVWKTEQISMRYLCEFGM